MSRLHASTLRECERVIIARALIAHGHNRTHTAHALGISRRTLLNRIRDLHLIARADVHRAAGETPLDDFDFAAPIEPALEVSR